MLHATIRQIELVQAEVTGEGLPEVQEKLAAARPEGFDLILAPVAMLKGQTAISAVGTYARRDGLREIEAETLDQLRAQVPDGWQLLNVRRD
ncbi:hypothetical protein [Leucobacter musarum]|uniref:hypothetical protein n=1 Tax=Leucobacter musarum TaxID=1930747 RepID=UPI0006A7EB0C|nr:hypothetical protein [Leucobacter musarum]